MSQPVISQFSPRDMQGKNILFCHLIPGETHIIASSDPYGTRTRTTHLDGVVH